MYCTLCVREKKHNLFTAGTSNFRVKTMEMHIKGVDHKAVLDAQHLRRNNVQIAVNRMVCARSKAVIAAKRNVYYLAKELLLTHKNKSLNNSTFKGLMTDESTDISVEKLLCTYVNLINDGDLETHYLCNTKITACDAATVTQTIKEQLQNYNIDLSDITGVRTDGAAVMTGRENGFVARFKRENPAIGGTHCAAHKLNLCAQQAAVAIPALQRYQRAVGSIYGYFNSSSRQARLKEMHVILDTDDVQPAVTSTINAL
ncbi:hypothetical protein KUCAC02_018700 [Chaenocephalus aceratus]|uniref:Uncharacterized protein n=1 Tax=Chaenocephalus aceratus TaxID=36190 RepID=A0ACB9WAN8_CHAAC|nr:hypothetical protein KUCAC02_018700 [Chaenocephalus aceratus]